MSGDPEREWFVRELIAALQAQDALAQGAPSAVDASAAAPEASEGAESAADARAALFTGLFAPVQAPAQGQSSRADLAAEAYEQLQFDFPQVQEQQIKALAEIYRSFASSTIADGASVGEFALSRTLVEGIAYLNEHGDGAGGGQGRRSEASGMLAAAVLLELVKFMVGKRGTPKVRALLADLVVPPSDKPTQTVYDPEQAILQPAMQQIAEDGLEEKFAAQEDPDDLSEVYEGAAEPVNRYIHKHSSSQFNDQIGGAIQGFGEKLRFLASHTFSSSFAALSVERWQDWGLDDTMSSIIKMLLASESASDESDVAYFGVEGEWTRYLFILRDRLLQFPASSQRGIRNLKDLVKHFQTTHRPQFSLHRSTSKVDQEESDERQQPHHVVYRVLAELVVSKEFQQRSSQRAQESLASAIYDLLPLIVDELQLLSRSSAHSSHDDDRIVIFLQLLHFLMLTAANVRTMAERLHESGVLRTLLSLLPSAAPASDASVEPSIWFRPFFRLIGECALWHEGIATYVSRVPRAAALLPRLPELLPPEAVVLAFSFHQHQVSAPSNVWDLFSSPALFPRRCDNYLEAMDKLQGAIFVLDSLATAIPAMRPPVRAELQQHVQRVYATVFPSAFEYPAPEAMSVEAKNSGDQGEETNKTHDEDRGRAEGLQFNMLRNKLRQTMKTLLLGLTAGPGDRNTRLPTTSKMD